MEVAAAAVKAGVATGLRTTIARLVSRTRSRLPREVKAASLRRPPPLPKRRAKTMPCQRRPPSAYRHLPRTTLTRRLNPTSLRNRRRPFERRPARSAPANDPCSTLITPTR
uniref:(northern house mosquito) hypothetical protein n=1 Tax=Culex pipiens TaxID=7175 RepID=A0A8D8HM23_CULPI